MSNNMITNMNDWHDFKHQTSIHVRYDDLDTMGHVNNKTYLGYLEEARIKYFEDVMGFEKGSLEFGAVVGRVDISFRRPIFYGEQVRLLSRVSKLGNKSFDIATVVVSRDRQGQDHFSAQAQVTLVSVDAQGRTVEIPQDFRARVEAFEAQGREAVS